MKTEITENNVNVRGEIYYDSECPLCMRGFMRFSGLFSRRGFRWLPMQTPGLAARLNIEDSELRREMKLLRPDGELLGGINTWIYLLRSVWWLRPLAMLLEIPGVHAISDRAYRWLAENRYCFGGNCPVPIRKKGFNGVEIGLCFAFVAIVVYLCRSAEAWVFMWATAIAMGFVGKWITFRDALFHGAKPTFGRFLIWFLAWPGLDGRTFFDATSKPTRPGFTEWLWAIMKVGIGFYLFRYVALRLLTDHPMLAGWSAMIGLILLLHFGCFHFLSLAWRACGINAEPIMRSPLGSTSLGELWGTRWNTAFSIPARRLLLRRFSRGVGLSKASFAIFVLSGLLHEVVITVPARGGFGLPTAYFALQGLGVLIQNSRIAREYHFDRGTRGWLFTFIFAAAPAYWLFPPIFVYNVMLPMLRHIGPH